MNPTNFFMFKQLLSICNSAIFIILTTSVDQTLSVDSRFESCEPKTCDNGPIIKFPFWSSHHQEPFCGYPDLEITCNDKNPVIRMSNDDYVIKDISYTDHSLLVSNAAVYEDTCPTPLHNVSLDKTPFHISPGYNAVVFFLYNCTSKPEYLTYPVDCASSSGNYSFAGFHLELYNYSLQSCNYLVNAPVRTGDDIGELRSMNYSEILKMGFLLSWSAHDCSTCESSGGRCGFENNEFVCFCSDHPHLRSCDDGKGWNLRRKILIGVAASLGTALVLVVGFIIWYRRKKKRHAPTFVSKSITSDPSSKADIEIGGNYNGVHLFTYEELEAATNNFDSAKELGEGGFGTVYYGQLYDGRTVAVKRLYENNYKRVGQFMNEVDILTRLRHPHLVSLYGCTSRSSRELLLVYEYVPNGTVADHLHGERAKPGALPWTVRMNIAVETASALAYLHKSDIIHRDVKTNNILLDNNYWVKVADFGLSRLFPTDVTHVSTAPQGTPGYVDPEYHECYQLTSKSDVYSFGVVLIELISSMPAVDITRHRQEINLSNMAINKIQRDALNELVDPNLGFESDYAVRKMVIAVAELAFRCLQWAKDMRPPMDEVLEALKEIQNAEYSMEKGENLDILSDNVGLLKSVQLQLSPDTVTTNWTSTSTTPSASGKSVLDSGKEEILEITSDNVGLLRSTAPMQPSSGTVTTNASTMPNASG